jgi:hypothetical protein
MWPLDKLQPIPSGIISVGAFIISAFSSRLPIVVQDVGLYAGLIIGSIGVLAAIQPVLN